MDSVTLRRAGGSLTMTIPRTLVNELGLAEGAKLDVSIESGRLVAEPAKPQRPRFALEDLLADCDPQAGLAQEEQAWLDDGRTGDEIL
jgi:antitoxin ChpS